MTVVTNSSVLIALSSIHQLDLLAERFPDGVLIPETVWREVAESEHGLTRAPSLNAAQWLKVTPVQPTVLQALLNEELDEGETEAVALCLQTQADLILLDEKNARSVAKRLGLKVLGTVGILIWARQTGRIASLKAQLDALQTNITFRLSRAVYANALRAVGESER